MPVVGGGLVGVVLFALWVYCIFDVIRSEETLVRNLPKIVWLLLVIFTWVVGAVAWLVLGRPQGLTTYAGGTTRGVDRKGPVGPEDSPKFMSALEEKRRLEKWEQELRRREERLRRSEEEGESGPQN